MARTLRSRKVKVVVAEEVEEKLPEEVLSSSAGSGGLLTQEEGEKMDVEMAIDGEEVEAEEMEESQTLLDIRREAAEALVSTLSLVWTYAVGLGFGIGANCYDNRPVRMSRKTQPRHRVNLVLLPRNLVKTMRRRKDLPRMIATRRKERAWKGNTHTRI